MEHFAGHLKRIFLYPKLKFQEFDFNLWYFSLVKLKIAANTNKMYLWVEIILAKRKHFCRKLNWYIRHKLYVRIVCKIVEIYFNSAFSPFSRNKHYPKIFKLHFPCVIVMAVCMPFIRNCYISITWKTFQCLFNNLTCAIFSSRIVLKTSAAYRIWNVIFQLYDSHSHVNNPNILFNLNFNMFIMFSFSQPWNCA